MVAEALSVPKVTCGEVGDEIVTTNVSNASSSESLTTDTVSEVDGLPLGMLIDAGIAL